MSFRWFFSVPALRGGSTQDGGKGGEGKRRESSGRLRNEETELTTAKWYTGDVESHTEQGDSGQRRMRKGDEIDEVGGGRFRE